MLLGNTDKNTSLDSQWTALAALVVVGSGITELGADWLLQGRTRTSCWLMDTYVIWSVTVCVCSVPMIDGNRVKMIKWWGSFFEIANQTSTRTMVVIVN